jgi:hypothetical protein
VKRTPSDIYATARAAGLNTAQAVIATAIALGESGGDDTSVGDINLQNSTWGPSVGLWQIRTLVSETGTGSDRDVKALQGNPARQALAMVHISNGGTNWSPWTVYTRGIYTKFMGQATAAMSGGTPITGVSPTGTVTTPVGYASDLVSDAVERSREVLIRVAFSGLGLALIGAGIVLAMRPQIQKAADAATKTVTDKVDTAKKLLV